MRFVIDYKVWITNIGAFAQNGAQRPWPAPLWGENISDFLILQYIRMKWVFLLWIDKFISLGGISWTFSQYFLLNHSQEQEHTLITEMENVFDLENFSRIKSCVAFYCMVLHVVVCYHCMVLISQILHLASKRVGWGTCSGLQLYWYFSSDPKWNLKKFTAGSQPAHFGVRISCWS